MLAAYPASSKQGLAEKGVGPPMVDVVLRRSRRGEPGGLAAAVEYAEMGWPVCRGAVPRHDSTRHLRPSARHLRSSRAPRGAARDSGRACSCDRIGCPAPGAHPVSAAWQIEASSDPDEVGRWWRERPAANIILVTGRVFDVLDVPAAAGMVALERMDRSPAATGPVALSADDRALFFVRTRGAPADEDEWWSCHLDCEPDSFAPVAGLRWHCRDSYVPAPARGGRGAGAHWIRDPREHPLPDGLRLLEFLADACEEVLR
jgi:Bifunctional DNA primase/polymerase, N-terminal